MPKKKAVKGLAQESFEKKTKKKAVKKVKLKAKIEEQAPPEWKETDFEDTQSHADAIDHTR